MATIILTAVGSALGGPIGGLVGASVGGALGALAGQAIDGLIFRPGPVSGPRLADLQVQTSRYGSQIPRLFGTIRVAGTVIWSTDLIESSETSGGGKGRPSVTRYSYAASFAVALSARRIGGIDRIWADGNLLRGSAGDLKAPLAALRIHAGGEDQPVDPLIAAAIGPDQTPAFRGCAYVLFEGLELADFGNRIPSLTFEVMADAAPVTLDALAGDLAGRAVPWTGAGTAPALAGFAASGGTLREATLALVQAHDLQWREQDGGLSLAGGNPTGRVLAAEAEVRAIDGAAQPGASLRRQPVEAVPARLAIRHHDPARDYQIGLQTALRAGPGTGSEEIDLPAALDADNARALADRKLRAALRRRTTLRTAQGWGALTLDIGDVIAVADRPGRWLVEARDWDEMAVRLRLRAFDGDGPAMALAGDSGTALLQPDLVQGATQLAIVEMPPDGAGLASAPVAFVAATGADAGWRRAALLRYRAAIELAEPIGRTAPRAVLGMATSTLAAGTAWRIDRDGMVEVLLDNAADALVSVDDGQLLQGAGLCQIGEEWLQFGTAEPIGPRHYRLRRLVRGWHGTEWAMAGHVPDERFVLIDPARLAPVTMTAGDAGQWLDVRATGSGDAEPAQVARRIDGRAMLPPAPVHGAILPAGGGDRAIRWTRRSRLGWGWPDLADAPLGEEHERYRIAIMAGDLLLRDWTSDAPQTLYEAADHAADLASAGGTPLRAEIRQCGTWGESRPLAVALD